MKVRELWVLYERVLRHFSVSPRIHAPILPDKLQKITKHFQCGYKQRQNWNIERIMQFFRIAAYVQVANCMAWYIMRLVHFALYKWLAVCACEWVWLIRLFMRSWLVWAFMAWERERVWRYCVFVSVDVECIIYYKRICKFICSL